MKMNKLPIILVALFFTLQAPQPAAQTAAAEDVESVQTILTAVYDVISGDAGVKRDWGRWHTLFAPGAALSYLANDEEGNISRVIVTPADYAEQSGPSLEQNGFHEIEIKHVAESYGNIAHVFSTYESRRKLSNLEPFARGINSFQLMNDGERWWVVSIYWQAEGPANPIPEKYLP